MPASLGIFQPQSFLEPMNGGFRIKQGFLSGEGFACQRHERCFWVELFQGTENFSAIDIGNKMHLNMRMGKFL